MIRDMNQRKSLIGSMFHTLLPVKHAEERLAFEKTIVEMLKSAWIDNCEDRLYYAVGEARARFNDVVGTYIRTFHARAGKFPEGYHEVVSDSKRIYFAPLSSDARKRLNASSIRSAEGVSA